MPRVHGGPDRGPARAPPAAGGHAPKPAHVAVVDGDLDLPQARRHPGRVARRQAAFYGSSWRSRPSAAGSPEPRRTGTRRSSDTSRRSAWNNLPPLDPSQPCGPGCGRGRSPTRRRGRVMKTVDRARGRWREILAQLGLADSFLRNQHGPCPHVRRKGSLPVRRSRRLRLVLLQPVRPRGRHHAGDEAPRHGLRRGGAACRRDHRKRLRAGRIRGGWPQSRAAAAEAASRCSTAPGGPTSCRATCRARGLSVVPDGAAGPRRRSTATRARVRRPRHGRAGGRAGRRPAVGAPDLPAQRRPQEEADDTGRHRPRRRGAALRGDGHARGGRGHRDRHRRARAVRRPDLGDDQRGRHAELRRPARRRARSSSSPTTTRTSPARRPRTSLPRSVAKTVADVRVEIPPEPGTDWLDALDQAEGGMTKVNGFIALPRALVQGETWQALSPRAAKIFIAMWSLHNGKNNGGIRYSVSAGHEGRPVLQENRNHQAAGAAGRQHDRGGRARRPQVERR